MEGGEAGALLECRCMVGGSKSKERDWGEGGGERLEKKVGGLTSRADLSMTVSKEGMGGGPIVCQVGKSYNTVLKNVK